jgi:hypothetical protein
VRNSFLSSKAGNPGYWVDGRADLLDPEEIALSSLQLTCYILLTTPWSGMEASERNSPKLSADLEL